jgi:hypothetical protein
MTLVFSLVACGDEGTTTDGDDVASGDGAVTDVEQGDVLRIYCWNEEFQSRFNDYYADQLPEGIEVEWVITPNADNAYQNKLDQDLLDQDSAENPIDIFLIEADYALKYVDSEFTLDVMSDIGLTADDISGQYQYTQDIATDSEGSLKGVTWQATPGLFAYRRSIATEVLGTDDPDEVQALVSDWDKFDAVAADMADAGYTMLAGYDDAYRTFSNNVSGPWVDENNKIVIDDNLMRWVEQTKTYTDSGYNKKASLWSAEWSAEQGPDGSTFGFFYSTWGINFTLLGNSLETPTSEGGALEVGNGIFGDWAVCEGPESYYWGGTWICAAKGTDNAEVIRDVMYTLTCDAETMKNITLDTQDYTNNIEAMEEIGNSDFESDFLGGQNHIALFAAAAKNIDMSNISPYDQGCNEEFQEAFKSYFDGIVTEDEALNNFYTSVVEKYPGLSK